MPFTNEDKLQWEVQKLQAETRNLSRPFLRQPAFWVGLGTLTLSIATNVLQLSNAERNRQLAEIRTQSLQLDARRLEAQKAELENTLRDQRAQLAQVSADLEQQQEALGKLKTDVAATGATRESLLKKVTELQQSTANLGTIVETTARNLASAGSPQRQPLARDVEKAGQLEGQAYEALVAKDFAGAQRLFQASETAANGLHYSYEWARLLRTRKAELDTPEGQRAVLQFALAKGYASYAPEEIRSRLRQQAE